MKPILQLDDQYDSVALAVPTSVAFPRTDFNYQSKKLGNVRNRCTRGRKPAFHTISQDYFGNEAPQHFAREAALFCMMMITVALPLLNGANAIAGLIRSMGKTM